VGAGKLHSDKPEWFQVNKKLLKARLLVAVAFPKDFAAQS